MTSKSVKKSARKIADDKPAFSLIPHKTLIALYDDLLECRKAARGVAFDAIPAAVCMDIMRDDIVVSAVRDAAVRVKRKGKPALQMTKNLDAVLGAALLHKTRKTGKVGVVFGQDSALPAWKDAVESARQHGLPLIFVSRMSEVDQREVERELRMAAKNGKKHKAALAEGYLPRIHVDANDVVAVYRVAHEAIDRARRGRGATWIKGVPFRVDGRLRGGDPVAGMEQYLRSKGLLKK